MEAQFGMAVRDTRSSARTRHPGRVDRDRGALPRPGQGGIPGETTALPNGIYPVSGGVNNLDYHHWECRLQMIVHFADKWTAAVDEEGRG